MSRFNHYMNSHFSSCTLLAYARDMHRERDVQLFRLAGEWEAVGVSDGVDAWIAPVVRGAKFFHTVDVWQLLNDAREGKEIPKPTPLLQGRRRLLMDDDAAAPAQTPRRRVIEEVTQDTTQRRRRDL